MFFVHTKQKAGVFKFLRFGERFRKAPLPRYPGKNWKPRFPSGLDYQPLLGKRVRAPSPNSLRTRESGGNRAYVFVFLVHILELRLRNFNTQPRQSSVILDLNAWKTRAGKSQDYCFRKVQFSECFPSTLKCKTGWKKVFENLRFRMD